VNLKVEDYFQVGKRSVLRFGEKGGKEKEIPVHHQFEAILDRYLDASGLRTQPDSPLFLESISKRGLCGLLLNFQLLFILHSRIPANEGLPELVIEYLRPHLE